MSLESENSFIPDINFKMKGGVLGLDIEINIKGDNYSVSNKGQENQGKLDLSQINILENNLQELRDANPKPSYGLAGRVRDQMSESLRANGLAVNVLTDRFDPAPAEYFELRKSIIQLAPLFR